MGLDAKYVFVHELLLKKDSSVLVLRSGASPLAEHRLVEYLVF